jgi:DNA-directed RNA polymerase specialized sigma24 family protein
MFGVKKTACQEATPYAIRADFCRIFQQDMNRLYLLSYLLTGDEAMAELCFVRALEASEKGNSVFKEWARSWVRRTIIQNAIQIVRSQPTGGASGSSADHRHTIKPVEMDEIVELPLFERFVFVISVLEGYSDQECSVLLNCSRAEIVKSRTRTLQKIGKSVMPNARQASVKTDGPVLRGDAETTNQMQSISHLAAWA